MTPYISHVCDADKQCTIPAVKALLYMPEFPNLGYIYPQEYKPGHLGVREKN
jgi:hypothetical protein